MVQRLFLTAFFAVLAVAPSLRGQAISPPFGLEWGASPERIRALADRIGSAAERRTDPGGRDRIELAGPFPDQRFRRLTFTFETGHLVQVAVNYPQPDDGVNAKEMLASLRRELEQSFGAGELLEAGTETNPDGFQESRRVFRWQRDGCAVWLISLEVGLASQLPKGEFSVIYANLGLGRRLEIEAER